MPASTLPLPAGSAPPSRAALPGGERPRHHFTVDLEEYFHVRALEPWVARADWDGFERRVAHGTGRLLEMLGEAGARATFFVLGWTAARHPELVREVAAAGHEIASHGWDHRPVTEQTAAELRVSLRRTKALLEDMTGAAVLGFRAPSFSIVRGREWALEVVREEGHLYDSSLFPVRRPGYGYAGGGRDPYVLEQAAGALLEVPPTTLLRWGVRWPAAGGGYLRLLPEGVVRAGLRQAEGRGQPGTFYIHPWELDPDQPRLPVSWLTGVRHYGGLAGTAQRVRRLLGEFRFRPIRDLVAER